MSGVSEKWKPECVISVYNVSVQAIGELVLSVAGKLDGRILISGLAEKMERE